MLEVYKSSSKLTQFSFGENSIHMDHCHNHELDSKFKEPTFRGQYKENIYEDFKISHGILNFAKPTKFNCTYLDSTIEMLFLLHGEFSANLAIPKEKHCFKFDSHNLIHYPCSHTTIEFNPGDAQFISIQLTPRLFNNFMPSDNAFEAFNSLFLKQQTTFLKDTNLTISFPIQLVLEEIIESSLTGHFRKLFLHAKVLELLLLQLHQYRFDAVAASISISEEDKLKIQQAKQFVSNNYNKPITIPMVAKHIGTNEFTLKKGFKELVGTTVFGYINDIKMDKAKKMLVNKNLSISQISELIGYKNPQHFSTAFKKKFGIVPSKFKT